MDPSKLTFTLMDCIVPQCINKKSSKSGKLFFELPSNTEIRKKWMTAMRKDLISEYSVAYICEDHFNLKEDVTGCGMVLKEGVIPHKFGCQRNWNQEATIQQQVEVQINGKKHLLKGTILPASSNMISKLDLSKLIIKKSVDSLKIASQKLHEEIDSEIKSEDILEGNIPIKSEPLDASELPFQTNIQQAKIIPNSKSEIISGVHLELPSKSFKVIKFPSGSKNALNQKETPTFLRLITKLPTKSISKSQYINLPTSTKIPSEATSLHISGDLKTDDDNLPARPQTVTHDKLLNQRNLTSKTIIAENQFNNPNETTQGKPTTVKVQQISGMTKIKLIPHTENQQKLKKALEKKLPDTVNTLNVIQLELLKNKIDSLEATVIEKDVLVMQKQQSSKEEPIILKNKSSNFKELLKIVENELLSPKEPENELTSPKERPVIMEDELLSPKELPMMMENELSSPKATPIIMENELLSPKELPMIMQNELSCPKATPIIMGDKLLSPKEVPREVSIMMKNELLVLKERPTMMKNKSTNPKDSPIELSTNCSIMIANKLPEIEDSDGRVLEMDGELSSRNIHLKRVLSSNVLSTEEIGKIGTDKSCLKRIKLNEEKNTEKDVSNIDTTSNEIASSLQESSNSGKNKNAIVESVNESGVQSNIVTYGNKKYFIKIGVLNKDGSSKELPVTTVNEVSGMENESVEIETESPRRNTNLKTGLSSNVLSEEEIGKIIKNFNDKSYLKKMKEIITEKEDKIVSYTDETIPNSSALESSKNIDNLDDNDDENEIRSNIVTYGNKRYVIKMGVLNKDGSLKNKKISKVIQCSNVIKKIMIKNKDDPTNEALNDTKNKIANIKCLLGQFKTISMHNITEEACALSNMNFISKTSDGLNTQLYLKCKGCQKVFKIFLIEKSTRSKLNISAVSASVRTGMGYGGLQALCNGIGVRPLFEKTYNCYTDMLSRINDHNKTLDTEEVVSGNSTDPLEFERVSIKEEYEEIEDINEDTNEETINTEQTTDEASMSSLRKNISVLRKPQKKINFSGESSSSFINDCDIVSTEYSPQDLVDEVVIKEENMDLIKEEMDFNNYQNYYSSN